MKKIEGLINLLNLTAELTAEKSLDNVILRERAADQLRAIGYNIQLEVPFDTPSERFKLDIWAWKGKQTNPFESIAAIADPSLNRRVLEKLKKYAEIFKKSSPGTHLCLVLPMNSYRALLIHPLGQFLQEIMFAYNTGLMLSGEKWLFSFEKFDNLLTVLDASVMDLAKIIIKEGEKK